MGMQTKTIGRMPTNHGQYDPQLAYGKKFIVTLFDCGWESKHDNNTSAPATLNAQAGTITENTTDWKKKWGSYKQWLIDNGYQKMDASKVKDGNNTQHDINAAFANEIGSDSTPESIKGRIINLEEAVGSGGSVDERIAEEGAKHYLKSETYNKEEVNNLITTPNQEYVSVTANAQTTDVTDVLPSTGASDTTYRVGNWDGTQYNESEFSEYAWNGSAYIKLSTKSQVGEVYDISANHADAKYADLAAALNGGANIPQSLQKGGMSVKFVQSSDNKYVQFRYMGTSIANADFTNVANWQGVDDEPTAGSDNLVKSGGVAAQNSQLGQEVNYNIASAKLLVRPGRILPASIDNGAWQIRTEYHHIVVPVIPGSTIEFITVANGIYYGFLQNYIIPVDGVIPSYVQGYEGRQWTTEPLVIPEGCNYLIIEIGDDITPTSLIINGFELVNGYGQYLMSISKKRALHYFENLETKVFSSFFKNNVSKDYGIKSVSTNFAFTSAVLKQYYNRNVGEGSYSQVFRIDFIVDGSNIDFIYTVLNGSIKSGYDTFTIVKNNKKVTVSLNWQPHEEELSLEFVPDTILHEVVDNSVDNIIADLPTSTDGSDIGVGYAYINAVTGVVTVKLD